MYVLIALTAHFTRFLVDCKVNKITFVFIKSLQLWKLILTKIQNMTNSRKLLFAKNQNFFNSRKLIPPKCNFFWLAKISTPMVNHPCLWLSFSYCLHAFDGNKFYPRISSSLPKTQGWNFECVYMQLRWNPSWDETSRVSSWDEIKI